MQVVTIDDSELYFEKIEISFSHQKNVQRIISLNSGKVQTEIGLRSIVYCFTE